MAKDPFAGAVRAEEGHGMPNDEEFMRMSVSRAIRDGRRAWWIFIYLRDAMPGRRWPSERPQFPQFAIGPFPNEEAADAENNAMGAMLPHLPEDQFKALFDRVVNYCADNKGLMPPGFLLKGAAQ